MADTLLLCFVHGFKGDNNTFHEFHTDLQESLAQDLDINVVSLLYPKYETQGDLSKAVKDLRRWLLDRLAEYSSTGHNATTDKSSTNREVGVILLAHSMGGLIVADMLLSMLDEKPITTEDEPQRIYPYIYGILTFDTPYMGLSNAMFAYGAFAQYQNASTAYSLFSSLPGWTSFGGSRAAEAASATAAEEQPAWKVWQLLAIRTGAAGAIAAAGAAAYIHREDIRKGLSYVSKENMAHGWSNVTLENAKSLISGVNRKNIEEGISWISRENVAQGLSWLSGHLNFVGSLIKRDELRQRARRLSSIEGIGFANLYSSMGANSLWSGGYFVAERTFCAVPPQTSKIHRFYIKEVNAKARDEIGAHMHMFQPDLNTGYDEMFTHAKGLIASWAGTYRGYVKDQIDPPHTQKGAATEPQITKYIYNPDNGTFKMSSRNAGGWSANLIPSQYISGLSWSNLSGKRQPSDPYPALTSFYFQSEAQLADVSGGNDVINEYKDSDAGWLNGPAATNPEPTDVADLPGVTNTLDLEKDE